MDIIMIRPTSIFRPVHRRSSGAEQLHMTQTCFKIHLELYFFNQLIFAAHII